MDRIGTAGGYPPDLGAQLARFRVGEKLSQSDMAKRLKVDQSRISSIGKGDVTPSESEIKRFLMGVEVRGLARIPEISRNFMASY